MDVYILDRNAFTGNRVYDSRFKKGFIAQQVEKVFPQAVTQREDFTPGIFAMAEHLNVTDSLLTITMKAAHNLKNGDIVRVMQKDKDTKEVALIVGYQGTADDLQIIVNDPRSYSVGTDPYVDAGGKVLDTGQYLIKYNDFVKEMRWTASLYRIKPN